VAPRAPKPATTALTGGQGRTSSGISLTDFESRPIMVQHPVRWTHWHVDRSPVYFNLATQRRAFQTARPSVRIRSVAPDSACSPNGEERAALAR